MKNAEALLSHICANADVLGEGSAETTTMVGYREIEKRVFLFVSIDPHAFYRLTLFDADQEDTEPEPDFEPDCDDEAWYATIPGGGPLPSSDPWRDLRVPSPSPDKRRRMNI